MRSAWTPAKDAVLITLWNRRATFAEMQTALGVSRSAILGRKKRMEDANPGTFINRVRSKKVRTSQKNRRWTQDDLAAAARMLDEQHQLDAIALQFGVSAQTLYQRLRAAKDHLGLDHVPAPKRSGQQVPARRATAPKRARARVKGPAPDQNPTPFLERTRLQCAWPLWDDETPASERMVCGAPVESAHQLAPAYCGHCASKSVSHAASAQAAEAEVA